MDIIIEWQQRGITARILGVASTDNPLLTQRPNSDDLKAVEDWRQKVDAWLFGWSIEDAMRNDKNAHPDREQIIVEHQVD